MISAHNYFRRLRELKNQPHGIVSHREDLSEVFRELPVSSKNMIGKIIEDGKVDAQEVLELKQFIYRHDDPMGYDIRLLFEIHDHVYGNENDPAWDTFFLEETVKYFSKDSGEKKKLRLVKAALLFDQIKNSVNKLGMMSEVEVLLMKNLIEYTGDLIFMNKSDQNFLSSLFDEILQDSKIDIHEVEILKNMIFQDNPPIAEDLDLLFTINLATIDKPKHEMWQALFIEAISSYLKDASSNFDRMKIHWLEMKFDHTIDKYKCLTTEEKLLLTSLREQTTDFPPGLDYYYVKYCQ